MTWMIRTALALSVTVVPAAVIAQPGCTTVFEDTFDGTSLDRHRWATRFIYDEGRLDHLNDEVERYRDRDNHVVRNGVLSLVARPATDGLYESGMIRSRQTFLYGYFEARVRLPGARGIWPAFWLNPDRAKDGSLTWPPEIDIFEFALNGRDDTDAMLHSGVHEALPSAPTWRGVSPSFDPASGTYRHHRPLTGEWHVFGLLWQPDQITVSMDGRQLYARTFQWRGKDGRLAAPAHLILNLAVGGQWAGRYGIDRHSFPQALDIDYVRVCQPTK